MLGSSCCRPISRITLFGTSSRKWGYQLVPAFAATGDQIDSGPSLALILAELSYRNSYCISIWGSRVPHLGPLKCCLYGLFHEMRLVLSFFLALVLWMSSSGRKNSCIVQLYPWGNVFPSLSKQCLASADGFHPKDLIFPHSTALFSGICRLHPSYPESNCWQGTCAAYFLLFKQPFTRFYWVISVWGGQSSFYGGT